MSAAMMQLSSRAASTVRPAAASTSRAAAAAAPRPAVRAQRRAAAVGGRAQRRHDVRAHFFSRFRTDSQDAGIYGSQGRDDFTADDVEHYFNYMGMLAVEGSYDRMEEMMSAGLDPVDVLLLMAASENDIPKVEELLGAGANVNIADNAGKSPLQLATKPEVIEMIEAAAKKGVSV